VGLIAVIVAIVLGYLAHLDTPWLPSRIASILGSVLDIGGVIIFALGILAPPKAVGTWGGLSGGLPAWFEENRRDGVLGLGLILLGFAAQLAAHYLHSSQTE
jgi:hypothetical protein